MGSVGTPVIRGIIRAARGPTAQEDLLASVGLPPEPEGPGWSGEAVDEDAYYGLLERVTTPEDRGLPLRYGEGLGVDDLGALGLAVKTAPTVGDALGRLARYLLVLSDTLEYELLDEPQGKAFALVGRPHHRRGAALANECAFASTTSVLRQIVGTRLAPRAVSFRHPAPTSDELHREYFGCPVAFDAPLNAIHLGHEQVAQRTLLADEGLSSYLLAQLDDLRARKADRSLVAEVRGAVTDALPDGQPSRGHIARRLGMSERTLQRRLAEEGASFQELVTDARRDAAESLLRSRTGSVAEVAFLTGFSDQSAFTRAFKRWTGSTPAAYRAEAA